jgi:hypothetical protein
MALKFVSRLLGGQPQDALHVAGGVEHSKHLQGLGLKAIDDQVGVNQKEAVPTVGQFFAHVTDSGGFRQSVHGFFQGLQHAIGGLDAIVGDVVSNVANILRGAGGEDEWLHPLDRFRWALR